MRFAHDEQSGSGHEMQQIPEYQQAFTSSLVRPPISENPDQRIVRQAETVTIGGAVDVANGSAVRYASQRSAKALHADFAFAEAIVYNATRAVVQQAPQHSKHARLRIPSREPVFGYRGDFLAEDLVHHFLKVGIVVL